MLHSRIGASSMHRWSECPGSVRLCGDVPNTSSVYAIEGQLAHEHAAHRLEKGVWREDISDEMREAVEVYIETLKAECDADTVNFTECDADTVTFTEHKFDLSAVYPGLFGTCDRIHYYPATKLLRVYDYKHGAGVPVEVDGNVQLMYYGLGALLSTNFPCEEVELVIVQPRCFHIKGPVRRWKMPALEMMEFAASLADYAAKTAEPNAPIVVGDHCQFCPAAGICPKLHEKAQELAKLEFGDVAPINGSVSVIDYEKLAHVLGWLDTVESWAKSVRDFAYNESQRGKTIPGFKLVAKRAARKWTDPEAAEKFLKTEFPNSIQHFYTDPEFKSVPQVEKVLHKKQHEKLKPFIVSLSSGNVLVSIADARPEVKSCPQDAFAEADLLS